MKYVSDADDPDPISSESRKLWAENGPADEALGRSGAGIGSTTCGGAGGYCAGAGGASVTGGGEEGGGGEAVCVLGSGAAVGALGTAEVVDDVGNEPWGDAGGLASGFDWDAATAASDNATAHVATARIFLRVRRPSLADPACMDVALHAMRDLVKGPEGVRKACSSHARAARASESFHRGPSVDARVPRPFTPFHFVLAYGIGSCSPATTLTQLER